MRGGLDDALARLARREELRRRVADPPASPGAAVEEVIQAARRAVGRDRELSVTLTVAYRGRTSTVRVQDHNGEVMVSISPGQSTRPRAVDAHPAGDRPQTLDAHPAGDRPQMLDAHPTADGHQTLDAHPTADGHQTLDAHPGGDGPPPAQPSAASQLAELLRQSDPD
jgi:hypothetical protein